MQHSIVHTISSQADIWKTLWWSATAVAAPHLRIILLARRIIGPISTVCDQQSTVHQFFSLWQQSLQSFCSKSIHVIEMSDVIEPSNRGCLFLDALPLCLFGRAELTGSKPWNNRIRQSHKAVRWCVVAAMVPLCLLSFSHTSMWERAKCVPSKKLCQSFDRQRLSAKNVVHFTCNTLVQFWGRSGIL